MGDDALDGKRQREEAAPAAAPAANDDSDAPPVKQPRTVGGGDAAAADDADADDAGGGAASRPGGKKRKVVVMFGYVGAGYQGMQRNPGAKTIEDALERAFHAAGGVSDDNTGDFTKVWRTQAAALRRVARA